MSVVSKDKEKLHGLFKNSFDDDITYAYLQNGEAVGFLGLGTYQTHCTVLVSLSNDTSGTIERNINRHIITQ